MSRAIHWNPADVQTLIDTVRDIRGRGNRVNWNHFKSIFPKRTPKACRTLWDKHKNNPQYIQREEK